MPDSVEGLFVCNGGLKVHCYCLFAGVIHVIHCFKRTGVGAYRIRPPWRGGCPLIVDVLLCAFISISLTWGRMRYAPTLVRLLFWFYWVVCWFHFRPHEGVSDTPLHLFGWFLGFIVLCDDFIFAHIRAYPLSPIRFALVLYLMSVERPHYLQLGIKKCKSFGFSFFSALTLHYLCIVWAIN